MVKASTSTSATRKRQRFLASFPLGAVVILLVVTILNISCGPTLGSARRMSENFVVDDGWYNATVGTMMGLNINGICSLWTTSSSHQDQSESKIATNPQETIPLPELVRVNEEDIQCPPGMSPVPQQSNPVADRSYLKRKIPQIVHMTGKTKCLTNAFLSAVKDWTWDDYSFYFHDDKAVDRLLYERDWSLFPQLKNTMECLKGAGGGKHLK